MKLYGRSIRGLAHPNVQIFGFSSFEKEDIITIVKFGKFVELEKFRLCVELGFFSGVRE
jgi:hypothetical protein